MTGPELLPLIGIPIVVAGFALKLNPMLVVMAAGIATGLGAGIAPLDLLELIGEKFLGARTLVLFLLVLPIVGLVERYGLREQAAKWIARFRHASAGRILLVYFLIREITAALNIPLGGHVSMVRPVLVPMLEGAAAARLGAPSSRMAQRIRANAAAAENIGVFFGQDIFIAFGAVLLMDAFLRENGIDGVEPLMIGLWGIPSAIAVALIHGWRISRLDAALARDAAGEKRE